MKTRWLMISPPDVREREFFGLAAGIRGKIPADAQICVLLAGEREKVKLPYPEGILILRQSDPVPASHDISLMGASLEKEIRKWEPDVILFPASDEGKQIAAWLAGKMGIGLTADLTDFYMDEKGVLHQIRMAYGASLQAEIVTCAGKIQMATIKMEQEKADIVVAGGLGAGKEGFALLARLARMLGGKLGASRAAVDAGLAPFSCQIGQSGNYVNPKIYFAFGISGAVQHLAGMKDSGRIVAVNTDERAPIFDYADYKICHDAADTARMMLECLENRRKKREAGQKTQEERK